MIRLLLPMFSIRRRLAAWVSSAVGRLQFGMGSLAAARRNFEKVLELKGDDFRAYVYLARIAYRYRDVEESMREFENARRTDPERFLRLRLPLELHRADLASLSEFPSERTCWSPVPVSHRTNPRAEREEGEPDQEPGDGESGPERGRLPRRGHTRPGSRDPARRDGALGDGAQKGNLGDEGDGIGPEDDRGHPRGRRPAPGPRVPMGDFLSSSEARRFRDRAPIRKEEITSLDWTRFMRDLAHSASDHGKGRPEPGKDPEV